MQNSPENTSKRDPLAHLLGLMTEGNSGYITGMESAGQRQLVHSDRLPTQARDGEDAFLALGFTFGPADPADPLFRPATLPQGWRKEGSDHAMWSHVVDDLGRKRVSIFYKAAFYDRDAFMSLESVHRYASECLYEDTKPIFDDAWCTPAAFSDALEKIRKDTVEREELYASKLDDPRVSWAAEELTEIRAKLVKIDALAKKTG